MSTPNPFAQPDKGGDFFSPKHHPEWMGRLFLIYPDRLYQKDFEDGKGPKDFVEADVVIIDLPDPQTGQPTVMIGAAIGGAGLVPQIKKQTGGMVLGRLDRSAPKGSNDGAFILADYTDQDAAVAHQYVLSHPRQQFAQPVAQAAAPPQQQWGQAPAAPQPDPWAGVQAAPAGPQQGQWGAAAAPTPGPAPQAAPAPSGGAPGNGVPQWGAPAASAQAAPAPTAPASPSAALDPQLVAFLQSKGVNPEGMTAEQATMIANTLQAQQPPPF